MERIVVTKSAEETQRVGADLGRYLFPGSIISLVGELGSGKTCFVQGLAAGLGINKDDVISPSFVLVREYRGRLALYHLDFYRLDIEQVSDLALEEYFYRKGATVLEWGNKVEKLLPDAYLEINFKIIDRNQRSIEFIGHGENYQDLIKKININVYFSH